MVISVFPDSGYVIVALSNLDPPAASGLADFIAARLPLDTGATNAIIVVDDFRVEHPVWMDAGSPRRRQLVHVLGRPPGADQAEQYLRALQYAAPAPRPSLPRSATASAPDWLMHRDIALEGPMMLELSVFYVNGIDGLSGYSGPFIAPGRLALDAGPNQQFRIDILSPAAAMTPWTRRIFAPPCSRPRPMTRLGAGQL